MDTKSQIIEVATSLFQQKGFKGVGLNEILKTCNISKGSFYHHFPNGKEEALIACLKAISEKVTTDIEYFFNTYPTTEEATQAMIDKLIEFEREGTIAGSTFISIISDMGSLSDTVRNVCIDIYKKMRVIYSNKLEAEGFSKEDARSIAVTMMATFEGAIMLCLTLKSSDPLKTISYVLPTLFKKAE